jgi:hypothetical protein
VGISEDASATPSGRKHEWYVCSCGIENGSAVLISPLLGHRLSLWITHKENINKDTQHFSIDNKGVMEDVDYTKTIFTVNSSRGA